MLTQSFRTLFQEFYIFARDSRTQFLSLLIFNLFYYFTMLNQDPKQVYKFIPSMRSNQYDRE